MKITEDPFTPEDAAKLCGVELKEVEKAWADAEADAEAEKKEEKKKKTK